MKAPQAAIEILPSTRPSSTQAYDHKTKIDDFGRNSSSVGAERNESIHKWTYAYLIYMAASYIELIHLRNVTEHSEGYDASV